MGDTGGPHHGHSGTYQRPLSLQQRSAGRRYVVNKQAIAAYDSTFASSHHCPSDVFVSLLSTP